MKNLLAFLLGLVLTLAVLFLSFDNPFAVSEPTTAPTLTPTTAPTTVPTIPGTRPTSAPATEPITYDLPMSAIVLTDQTELSKDENGSVYFAYSYPNVRLYLDDEEVSSIVMLDLLNRIDATRESADTIRLDAQNISEAGCFYQVRYVPARIDGAVLSLSGTMTSFTGGAHPTSTCIGITYDLLTGKALTLGDILTEDCTADILCRMIVDALTENDFAELLYNDFTVSVEDRFSGDFRQDDGWYLSREGLCFVFEPYEIGPYASGIITAVIPYNQLPGRLKDDWFPPEQVLVAGDVTVETLPDDELASYPSLVEINLDPSADALVIHTDSIVYDIAIETTGPNPVTLFAADHLTPGYVIQIRGGIPMQIRYVSDGETHSQPIQP